MGNMIRDEFIKLAQSQVGYVETGNNHTKYSQYFDTEKSKGGPYPWFNGKKQNTPWCAIWICWLFVMVLEPKNLLGSPDAVRTWMGCPKPADNCAAGVPFLWEYFVKKKWNIDKSKGQAGDIIFLNTKSAKNGHVGMIEKVDGSKYYTIEGNKSNGVRRSSYGKTSTSIYGICHPNWDSVPDPEEEKPAEPIATPEPAEPVTPAPAPTLEPEPVKKKTTDELAKEVIAGKWGNGTDRANKLKAAGYDYNTVQNRVNEILGIKKPASSGKTMTVTAEKGLNVRTGASKDSKWIRTLKCGTEVTVYETKNGWARIANGQWCSMTYLK